MPPRTLPAGFIALPTAFQRRENVDAGGEQSLSTWKLWYHLLT
jgi:hypothetical protein